MPTTAGCGHRLRRWDGTAAPPIAPYKYPRFITFVDDLPKTATGKIQRYKLRDPG